MRIVCAMIEDFHEPFDVGIALHACGGASDVAMEKCVRARAAYVIAPCCVVRIRGVGGCARVGWRAGGCCWVVVVVCLLSVFCCCARGRAHEHVSCNT